MELSFLLVAAWSLCAAIGSWHLAARQGRNARRWTLATVLLAGLPLIWLVIHDLFAMPTAGSTTSAPTRHMCCDNQSWTPIADFGHAGGCDLDLGQCEACGAYLMAVFYVSSTNYVVVSKEEAERFLRLHGTPALKKALKDWVG